MVGAVDHRHCHCSPDNRIGRSALIPRCSHHLFVDWHGYLSILLAQAFGISLLRGLQDFEITMPFCSSVLYSRWCFRFFLCGLFDLDIGARARLPAFAAGWLVQCGDHIQWWRAPSLPVTGMDAVHFADIRAALSYGWKSQVKYLVVVQHVPRGCISPQWLINPAVVGIYIVATQLAEQLWMLSPGS